VAVLLVSESWMQKKKKNRKQSRNLHETAAEHSNPDLNPATCVAINQKSAAKAKELAWLHPFEEKNKGNALAMQTQLIV